MNRYYTLQEIPDNRLFVSPGPLSILKTYVRYGGLLLFTVYAVCFLAVTVPFLPRHSLIVYVPGLFITLHYLFILYEITRHLCTYGQAALHLSDGLIILEGKRQRDTVSCNDVLFCSIRFDWLISFHTADRVLRFPLPLLQRDTSLRLCSYLTDMTPRRSALFSQLKETAEAGVLALLLAVHIVWYAAQNYYIPTGSMRNTLVERDHIFGEKISLGLRIPRMIFMDDEIHFTSLMFRPPKRGDIVIFRPPGVDCGREFIKRVIAVGGDTFHIEDGYVHLNGRRLVEPYATGKTMFHGDDTADIEGTVAAGHVVVLGDNRLDSRDSRMFGYVPVSRIRSRALFLYFNADQFKKLDFSRFGFIW
ncbi:MAG: signal peptidase I [Spirochaetota bacterium]